MPVYADCTFVKYDYCYSPLLEQKYNGTSGWCGMMAVHFVYAILSLFKLVAKALTVFGILWLSIDYLRVLWLRRKLPPGLFPLPLIGNHLDMRMKRPWCHWGKLSFDVYKNPMITLWNGHRPVICCNDAWTVSDMFEKRATIYSSRPRMGMMCDMTNTTNHNQVCLKYDDQWRTHRKLSHSVVGTQAVRAYRDFQSSETKILLEDLLTRPDNYVPAIERYSCSIVSIVRWGRRIKDINDPVAQRALEFMEVVNAANYETNATKSKLFSIPRVLRNRIYRLVIAGKEIHIFGSNPPTVSETRLNVKRKFFRAICQRQTTELEDTRALKACKEMKNEDYAKRHHKCQWTNRNFEPSEFSLDFLRVCRQIHQEAALMPFQENTFIFNNIIDLEGFIELEIPAQVAAIQHISFEYSQFDCNEAFEKRLQKKLGKLKNLIFFLERHGIPPPATVDEDHKAAGFMLRFRRLNIEQATFAAYNDHVRAWSDEQRDSALEWSRFMETALTKEWIEPEAEKKPVAGNKKGMKGEQAVKAKKTKTKRTIGCSKAAKKHGL